MEYSSHVHETADNKSTTPDSSLPRDIIDKDYTADANGYRWYDSSTQEGYKRITSMTIMYLLTSNIRHMMDLTMSIQFGLEIP